MDVPHNADTEPRSSVMDVIRGSAPRHKAPRQATASNTAPFSDVKLPLLRTVDLSFKPIEPGEEVGPAYDELIGKQAQLVRADNCNVICRVHVQVRMVQWLWRSP